VKEKLSGLSTAVLVACAVVITGLNVKRELFSAPAADAPRQGVAVQSWRSVLGQPAPPADAPVEIVVLADYTCRYCRQLETVLDSLQAEMGPGVQVRNLHYPLQATGTGFTAAVASECAALQQRGSEYHRVLYTHQDRLGIVAWDTLAGVAGVPDLDDFRACVGEQRTADEVRRQRARGEALGVAGTPTWLVNGVQYVGGAPYAELVARVRRASPRS
jgi:protein-disulfide isomerase